MRILFLGDIVGPPGVSLLKLALPQVVERERIDLVIANAENVVDGSGLKPCGYREIREAGVDLMTMGDHVYRRMEIASTLRKEERICRPANFPPQAPGREFAISRTKNGVPVAAFCLLGRTFMRPVDCPFAAADRVLLALPDDVRCVIVDIHAEATAEKNLMLHHLKGRVSAVIGTHTHVPTADEQVFPEGTAYITDVGMCGPHDSIIGRRVDRVLSTTLSFVPSPFDVAEGDVRLNGAIVELDPDTGKAQTIRRFRFDENEVESTVEPRTRETR